MERSKKVKINMDVIGSYGVFIVLIIMLIMFSMIAPHFFELSNFFNVARQICTLGIGAVGMTVVMITGGIDLSVGYQISLVNVSCAWLMVNLNMHPVLAVICGIAIGTAIGFLNGIIIVKSGVAPMIVTLAVMNSLNGVSYIISKGVPIFGFPESFSVLGQGNLGGVPITLIIMTIIFILGGILLGKVYVGRYFYAIGSNEEAAKLSGINVGRAKIIAYSLCGFLSSVGAVLLLSRTNSGLSSNGAGFEFNIITACVLGGVSSNGGKGTIFGALVGVLIVGFLDNGLLLMNVNQYSQLVIKGILMLLAVIYDTQMHKKSEEVKKIKSINANNDV